MAAAESWRSIRKFGLLSTSALLDLFEYSGDARRALEEEHRPVSVQIRHPVHGTAVVRDQKPMSDDGLKRALQDGLTPSEWYKILNSKTFFWLSEERLQRLLNARAYRDQDHDVLTIDTAKLLEANEKKVLLSPMNSGCTKPFPHARGRRTFLPLHEYPYRERRRSARNDAVVELAVEGGLIDVQDLVIEVRRMKQNDVKEILWKR